VIGQPLFAPRYPLCVLHVRVFLDIERDLCGMQPRYATHATHARAHHWMRVRDVLRREVWGRAAGVFNSERSC
jgi:hypothetical protein